MRDHGMEFGELRLKLLIHQQKCLECAAYIAVAPGHDLINRGLMKSGTHRKPPGVPRTTTAFGIHGFLWIMWKGRTREIPQ